MKKKRQKRDIYKGRFDDGFDINRDIDLEHLREIMSSVEITNADYNFYGLYVKNIIGILLNSSKFRGYPEDVQEDLAGEATIDMVKARTKFDGVNHPQRTAPFNYLYRIGYHSFQHVLSNYYRMQNRMTPATVLEDCATLDRAECNEDGTLDWDAVVQNLME